MKYILSCFLLVACIATTVPVHAADTAAANIESLRAQLGALQAHIERTTKTPSSFALLTHDEVRTIVQDGTDWLLAAQEENGHFAYEYVPYEGTYLRDDNIVRQGGALYALGEVYRREGKEDQALKEGIERAIEYFDSVSIEGEEEGTSFRCVAKTANSTICQLGATALVLNGILAYVEVHPEARKEYRDLIDDYLTYLLTAQKTTGGFRDTYHTGDGYREAESPFSNGEAILSLARAYQYEADGEIKAAIDRAFTYLKAKEYENPLYLWIMAALKDMQQLWPNDEYVSYARDFTLWRIARGPYLFTDRNYCAYAEGLASAYSIVSGSSNPQELARLRAELDRLNAYHASLQIGEADTRRVLIEDGGAVSIGTLRDLSQARGGFLTANSVPTQRIDFTQHCVSTYVQTLVDIDTQPL